MTIMTTEPDPIDIICQQEGLIVALRDEVIRRQAIIDSQSSEMLRMSKALNLIRTSGYAGLTGKECVECARDCEHLRKQIETIRAEAIDQCAKICDSVSRHDTYSSAIDCADACRVLGRRK